MEYLNLLSKEERLNKAVRHINDGINLRTVRNDIDSKN